MECLFKIYICFLFLTFSANTISLSATGHFSSFFKRTHCFLSFSALLPYRWQCMKLQTREALLQFAKFIDA